MTKKPDILERVFNGLSSFPYLNLRKVMTRMWIVITIMAGLSHLVQGIAIFKGIIEFSPAWISNLLIWAGGALLFGALFDRWRKHDNKKKTSSS